MLRPATSWRWCAALLCLALALPVVAQSPAESQPSDTQPASQPARQPVSQPATQPVSQPTSAATSSLPTTTTATTSTTTVATTQAAPEKERFLAVINGRVHTVTGPVLERATVLSRNGIITAIGEHVVLPPECVVVDATGLEVYPGLVAAVAGGLHGGNQPRDTTNVYALNMAIALAGGITTALAGNDVAKLTYGTTQDLILKANAYLNINYATRSPLERAQLRADLERVRTYLRDVQRFEREKAVNKDAKPPDKEWLKEKYENYRKLLAREVISVATANSTHELADLADLAQTYGFDLVVRGAVEGWTVAPALGRAGVRAVITPRDERAPDDRFNRPNGSSIENARILHTHGVTVAVVPPTAAITLWGLAGRDLLHLNMEAAFAVRGGLSNDAAVRTITIDAARVLGVDDRIGSLEIGKDADIVVCDGDLLHYMTQVRYTIVNGRVAYDKAKETLFAHIRPQGKPEVPQFDDYWPRRLQWVGE